MSRMMRLINKTPVAKSERSVSHQQKTNSLQAKSSATDHVLFLQRTIGNHAVQKLINSRALQAKLRIGPSIPIIGEENEFVDTAPKSSDIADSANCKGDGFGYNDLPSGDRATTGGVVQAAANSCDEPLSMNKVTSGAFQGGLKMEDYYPDLAGKGYWQHGSIAGTFDTGTQVGSNIQLYGTIPSPCRPDLFSLAQTVKYTKAIFNGVHHPKEGVVQDDIAKSGRDSSRPPFRQDWLEGGYNISMADPPGVTYGPSSNIEFDREFVTSLVGPGGRKSVAWSTSIKVVNGGVTKNTVA